jgi:mRNA interferase MazF
MRPIHVAQLDKARPVLVLTREIVQPHMNTVTVAPITRTVRGLSTEVPVGPANGLDDRGVVACDHVTTIPIAVLGPPVGRLLDDQEATLTEAIRAAFDLK